MNAAQVMTPNVQTVNDDATCEAAARIMWDAGVGSVPVLDAGRRVVGMVTDRDICMGAYTKGQRLIDIPVRAVMSKNVITAKEGDNLGQVEQLMQQSQIRRVPVVDASGRISGIIALADLARRRGAASARDKVSEQEIAKTVDAVSQPPAT